MNTFTQQLMLRHSGQSELVKPRQRSLFEPIEPYAGQSDWGLAQEKPIVPLRTTKPEASDRETERPLIPVKDFSGYTPEKHGPNSSNQASVAAQRRVLSVSPGLDKEEQADEKTPESPKKETKVLQPTPENSTTASPEQATMPGNASKSAKIMPQNSIAPRLPDRDWLNEAKAAVNTWLQPNTKPIIRISIGRLEVRTNPVPQATPIKSSPPPKPRMSLEDYLNKQKNNGK